MSGAERRREVLQQAQEELGGQLSWREFMRLALYDPEVGYYASEVRGIGARGDFTTVPARSGLLARSLQIWRERVGLPENLPWIEVGGGAGDLAVGLASSSWSPLAWARPAFQLVEVSPVLRKLQRQRLRGRKVVWSENPAEAWAAGDGMGVLVANELVDAFPCSVFELRPEGWHEVGVRFEGDGVFPIWIKRPLPESSIWARKDFAVGQRVEVHESFREWWAEWSPAVRRGWVVWIDYGASAEGLYQRQPRGSLRGYWKQQRIEWPEVLARFGRQDLTADVNFTDLRQWGQALGWQCRRESSLAEFLQENSSGAVTSEERRLLDLEDAGGAFQVLVMEKG